MRPSWLWPSLLGAEMSSYLPDYLLYFPISLYTTPGFGHSKNSERYHLVCLAKTTGPMERMQIL